MYYQKEPPAGWFEIDEEALDAALDHVNYRVDPCLPWDFYREIGTEVIFACRAIGGGKIFGSPEFFKP